jgi:hypothetical protein
MNYVFEINPGHKIYLQCQENQTIVTSLISSQGQQQQSSSSFQTGKWLSAPEIIPGSEGLKLKITGTLGEYYVQIQGNSIGFSSEQYSSPQTVTMKPMQPMQPMQPLKMGNMSMDANKMEMQMGNMEMKMGASAPSKPKFCSQCGNQLKLGDRFCSQCGSAI